MTVSSHRRPAVGAYLGRMRPWTAAGLLVVVLVDTVYAVRAARSEEGRDAKPTAATLRIVTLNVWGVPGAKDADARLARLPAALKALDADVLCLQEVWLKSWRTRIAQALAPTYVAADAIGGGLVVLSRLPLRDASFTRFPELEGLSLVERLAAKGWLEVVATTPAGDVRIVTTHLAHRGPAEEQLAVLVESLRGRQALPTLLAGDFNLAPDDDAIEDLLASGWRAACPVRTRADGSPDLGPYTRVGWPRVAGEPRRGWRPDHVFARGLEVVDHALALDGVETALSDHNAVQVTLRLARTPR